MAETLLKTQAFKLKGRLFTFTVISLLEPDEDLFTAQLAEIVAKAPRLFTNTPVVIDCSVISQPLNLGIYCRHIRAHGLIPVAVQGEQGWLVSAAQSAGLAILHANSSFDKTAFDSHEPEPVTVFEPIRSKLITHPVRSGQQVVSKGDLVITAAVSHGAELLADGHIHVYGPLRGRALAGIEGNKQARIFCQSLEAELVSIAGFYRLSDAIEPLGGPCQIYLQDDRIHIEPV
ncbi:septum site-determining protein MinC [Legionella londiniensis]|uniref:Probable septum site-determining protein MinC n=1 Tax=Legionella londiniensis TaxID=45068 RepID=A0A0W0VNB0_9GAMM|nr:septum site-determining protein MinC [Legionella londiniensis]KTD21302.1 septum site determining protein MinC [Legionella londiniensis]STX93328.1 septum site determining protein MinC [Legionella londiniensis]